MRQLLRHLLRPIRQRLCSHPFLEERPAWCGVWRECKACGWTQLVTYEAEYTRDAIYRMPQSERIERKVDVL